jgi:hypothetical protein
MYARLLLVVLAVIAAALATGFALSLTERAQWEPPSYQKQRRTTPGEGLAKLAQDHNLALVTAYNGVDEAYVQRSGPGGKGNEATLVYSVTAWIRDFIAASERQTRSSTACLPGRALHGVRSILVAQAPADQAEAFELVNHYDTAFHGLRVVLALVKTVGTRDDMDKVAHEVVIATMLLLTGDDRDRLTVAVADILAGRAVCT